MSYESDDYRTTHVCRPGNVFLNVRSVRPQGHVIMLRVVLSSRDHMCVNADGDVLFDGPRSNLPDDTWEKIL